MTIQANFPAIKTSLMLDFANTKQLDSRITYTRASTATFYNGVTTAKAEQNLATYSQQFDNAAWLKENSSITADSTTAPDGTTTADSLVESSANGPHGTYTALLSVTTASTVTVSIYAKQNTKRYIVLGSTDGFANYPVLFDLQSGVVVGNATGYPAYSAPTSSSITSVGSSWYRLTVTLAINGAASSARVIAYLTDDSGSVSTGFSYTGNGTSSAYIWGAQLEQRSAVTAYTVTTTQAITNYIPVLQTAASGVARFDNNPTTGESLGLLIEESRTNLFTYSSDFATTWATTSASVTANTIVSPDGTLNADKLIASTSASTVHYVGQLATTTAAAHTFSVYAKAAELGFIALFQATVSSGTVFNLSTGAVAINVGTAPTSSSITAVGNGWYRCTITVTATAASNDFRIYLANVGTGNTSFVGDGFSGVFIWGAQLEAGAVATSYIPTVASQVTRAADAASMTGTNFSSWYNGGESGIYGEFNLPALGGSQALLHLTDTAEANRVRIYAQLSGITRFTVSANGSTLFNNDIASVTTGSSKIAIGIKSGSYGTVRNAGTVGTNSSIPTPNGPTELRIGRDASSGYLNGSIKKISVYPIRPTDAQLQALTS